MEDDDKNELVFTGLTVTSTLILIKLWKTEELLKFKTASFFVGRRFYSRTISTDNDLTKSGRKLYW